MNRPDRDIQTKVDTSILFLNETIQYNANEPSLAFYRLQEHVQKALPIMIQKRYELKNLQEQINGLIFDIEYSVDAVKNLAKSNEHMNNIVTNLEKAVYIGKQISLFRQKHVQQQLFEKKDGPLLASIKK
ncbi:unnamed protein product [Rotaria sp. Silwood1]|nr:unnamed protein product [Rotaria sp. Silwood1]CAF1166037.1 unnamed protein product [Rotaria sp. Silwood1]CAF3432660.1 unnamed protein product [Rotaria sp. Silwood1]CAF3490892.1 unnamed protein product [Rotaria sp. Silwood1]CAF4708665.1 unnamed protein product [Rotaria sp. Silwood1]